MGTWCQEPLLLLVEDDEAAYEMLSDFLAQSGYRVIGATDGLEALRLAHDLQPDVVLVDHNLPGLSGVELTRRLKSEPRTSQIPVVLMTGHVEQRLLEQAARAGCDTFVRKPFGLQQLRHELEKLLLDVARAMPAPAPHVLVVEDDADVREALRDALEEAGYLVEQAKNGAEALALLKSGRLPSLILLDLSLPVLDGWQFVAMQQKDPSLARLPVVVLTGTRDSSTADLHAQAVLEKPIDRRCLIEAVDKALSAAAASSASRSSPPSEIPPNPGRRS